MQRTQFVILSHLRWVSAALVALSHVRNLLMIDYQGGSPLAAAFYFITGFGHAGVVVFFVLSGFLVGRKVRTMASEAQPDWGGYIVDRTARIFVVAIPAVLLSAAVLAAVANLAHDAPFVSSRWSATLDAIGPDAQLTPWLGTAVLLNEFLVRTPHINSPLWSLAYEWCYYVVALAGLLVWRKVWRPWTLVVLAYAIALLWLAAMNVPGVLLGGLVWLAGLVASAISDRQLVRGRISLYGLTTIALGAVCYWRVRGLNDLTMGVAIALAISHSAWRTWSWRPALGEQFAGFSFSLYVTHFPLAVLVLAVFHHMGIDSRLPFNASSIALVGLVCVVCAIAAYGFAKLTEDRTTALRKWLKGLARPRLQAVQTPPNI